MRRDLPTGTVTFLFTDVEGSTTLLHELGAEGYSAALLEHRLVLRETFVRHGDVEVDTQGGRVLRCVSDGLGAVDAARRHSAQRTASPSTSHSGSYCFSSTTSSR